MMSIEQRLDYLYDICVANNSAIGSLGIVVSILKEVIVKSKLMTSEKLDALIKIKAGEIEQLKVKMKNEYLEKIKLEKNKFIN